MLSRNERWRGILFRRGHAAVFCTYCWMCLLPGMLRRQSEPTRQAEIDTPYDILFVISYISQSVVLFRADIP